jgi:xylulokinase
MALFIGIDSGTQSTKAVVLDLKARRVIADARVPHQLIKGLPVGHMEQHPADWTAALDRVIREVVSQIGSAASQVRGIGVSGQQHGFVPLDAGGEVIRPAKLWCDTSTIAECDLITRRLGGPKAALRRTGNLILPGFTAPKILWLKRHEPANFRRLRHVLLPHDYLNFHLTGNYHMEYGDASGTALLDVRRRMWSREALQAIDRRLGEWVPDLSPPDRPSGVLRPELASRYGLPAGVIVSAGGGDNMMGAIGTGNVTPGVVTASFGTSGTIYARASQPIIDPEGEIAAFCSSDGGWLPLLCTMNVTTVTEQVRTLFGLDHDAMAKAAAATPAGSDGLILLPYLAGERTPNVPAGSGVLFGLNSRTLTAPHLARAAMEGVTLGMNYGLRRLAKLGVKPREIRVTGGGAKSAVWRQLMADIFGVPVVAMVEDESAALGGALQAAWTVDRVAGRKTKLAALTQAVVSVNKSSRCVPDRARARHYARLQVLQDRLSADLRDLFREHRSLLGA